MALGKDRVDWKAIARDQQAIDVLKPKSNPFAESWRKKNEKVHAKARSKALSKAK